MNTKNQQRNSVLLIHGIDDTGAVFNKMVDYLRQLGWSVYTLNLIPNNGEVGLDILAQQIADYVVNTFAPEESIDLIGFSMGGIVSRYYVQRLGGINRVQRFITISSPHHGTVTAYASQRHGCLQMRRNSEFIQDLNADAVMLGQLNFTSIWTPYDLMIVPAKSSQMPLGKEVVVPVVLHSWMLTDYRSLAAVASALSEPIKSGHQFGYTGNFQKSPLGGGNI
ncbi:MULTISPECIES: triacylglycerol lipase [unclassified Nodularia (in: cyanobacteria)]|uniref:esterase/lipase family protein n=1 Tax=unclassified Nodularia (in: cyanobacteria) TaxID=2656917 RepID=UPI00188063BD|nr:MULTISPECIES: triacylglycerol lipase [unclassified Nodularia (in: cyanobacteria)]MBE9197989.1 triacylglycerol lipase [Nodularia sp. LEGE 06071]MCC2691705.1 triacylglycerol lipase [Nodularia sp. LEGE 04288]